MVRGRSRCRSHEVSCNPAAASLLQGANMILSIRSLHTLSMAIWISSLCSSLLPHAKIHACWSTSDCNLSWEQLISKKNQRYVDGSVNGDRQSKVGKYRLIQVRGFWLSVGWPKEMKREKIRKRKRKGQDSGRNGSTSTGKRGEMEWVR